MRNLKEEEENVFIFPLKTKIGFMACFFNENGDLLGVLWNHSKKG
ncbi:hypothetical protein [Chryseobacterium paludis]|nr:hypothetical protein [Chryseobacterium paludis]